MTVVLDARVVTGSGGGPEKSILNSPRFLSPAGYRMLCAYMHPPGDPGFEQLREKARLLEAPLFSIPDRGPLDWKVFRELLRLCRRERVSIWHGHDYKSNALGLLLRRFWPMRLVTTVHGWVTRARRIPLYYFIDRLCLRHYEKVLCVSLDLHEECLAAGLRPERCFLVENGIDLSQSMRRRGPEEAKRQLGINPRRLVIGAVGRLSEEKGFDLLIRATGQLILAGRDPELLIAGEGEDRPRLEKLIQSLGLGENVRLLGYCPDVKDLYEAMDVFALSSLREGLPNVLLEAMALGVPVVATRVAGVPRLIKDGENGILIPPGDVGALTAGLRRLLTNAPLRDRFRQEARETVRTRFSFAARMEKIRTIYDDLLGRKCIQQGEIPLPIPDRRAAPLVGASC